MAIPDQHRDEPHLRRQLMLVFVVLFVVAVGSGIIVGWAAVQAYRLLPVEQFGKELHGAGPIDRVVPVGDPTPGDLNGGFP